MKKPMWSACSAGLPQNAQSRALGTTSFDTGSDGFVVFCSAPPCPNAQLPIQYAIQLSMIVVITSCAPVVALRKPAIAAHNAPAAAATTTVSNTCGRCDMCGKLVPIQRPVMMPIRYWPWPPMLNSPQRNANATARPVRISVVVRISVCWRLYAELLTIDVFHQKNTWWFVNGMSMW